MATATLGDATVTTARATLPRWGVWTAQAHTDRDAGLAVGDAATLTIADLVLVGHVVRGGVHVGAGHYLLAGGAHGWRKLVPARGYRNDAGVKLSIVAADLARDAGETLAPGLADRRLGPGWTRARDTATTALQSLSFNAWYVGEDGKTRLARRPASTLAIEPSLVLEPAPERASVVVALDQIAALVPETVIADVGTISHVTHMLSSRALRSRLYLDGAS